MGVSTKEIVKSGKITVEFDIIQYDDIDGQPAFDFRTNSELIQSGVWFPTAAEAERELRNQLGVR